MNNHSAARWIIVATLPSGTEMAFSYYEVDGHKTFALVPFDEHGRVKNALAWETYEEAEKHLDDQLEAAPKLNEFEIDIRQMAEQH